MGLIYTVYILAFLRGTPKTCRLLNVIELPSYQPFYWSLPYRNEPSSQKIWFSDFTFNLVVSRKVKKALGDL